MTAIAIQTTPNFNNDWDTPVFLSRDYSSGSSEESKSLQRTLEEILANLRNSATWNHVAPTIAILHEAVEECSQTNWDGYGAQPVSGRTYSEAIRFLNALPIWLPVPEIVPEPDGGIGFEWYVSMQKTFVASVNGSGKVIYAGLFGRGNKAHGAEVFNGTIPQTILGFVARVLPQEDALK